MTPQKRKQFAQYLIVMLGIGAGLVWSAVFTLEASSGFLRIHFFDVGQGDAIFIEAPNGNQVLVDGGPDNSVLAKLGDAMPFWDRSIDLVILTHPHADHLDGLIEVLKRYRVGMVIESGVNHSIPEYQEWRRILAEKRIRVVTAKAGQRLHISSDSYFDVLTPYENFAGDTLKDIHGASVIAKLTYGLSSILFTGDAEKRLEYQLIASGARLDADILKIGHHGSKTSTAEDFLKAVSPKAAVISAGRKNRYGHPHQDVLDRLVKSGIETLRTDTGGDITFISNGVQFSLDKKN